MALGTPSHVASGVVSNAGATTLVSAETPVFANNTTYLLAVTVKATAGCVAPTTITGGGMTWVSVATAPTAATNSLSLWRARVASGATTQALTFNFSANQTEVLYTLVSISGADTTGTNGSGAIVNFSTGQEVAALSFGPATGMTALAALASVNNGCYFLASHVANTAGDPLIAAPGWTKIEDTTSMTGTSNRSQGTFWRINDTSPSVSNTVTAAAWRGIAVEIKSGGGTGGGSVAYGIWTGGISPDPLPPSNDFTQAQWWCGMDAAAAPFAGGSGLGRNPALFRWRGGYGTGGTNQSIIKSVSQANYWTSRGCAISTNIKMTIGSGSTRNEPPFQDTINGVYDSYLTLCCNDARQVNGSIYMELF